MVCKLLVVVFGVLYVILGVWWIWCWFELYVYVWCGVKIWFIVLWINNVVFVRWVGLVIFCLNLNKILDFCSFFGVVFGDEYLIKSCFLKLI